MGKVVVVMREEATVTYLKGRQAPVCTYDTCTHFHHVSPSTHKSYT